MEDKIKKLIEKKKTSAKSAIIAFCHQCMGYWQDGKEDCQNTKCPLYKWMPYRKSKPDTEWAEYNAKKHGKVKEEDIERRELTDEEKKAASERLSKARKKKND